MDRAKPFCIAKRDVWEAYKQVKANQGAAGVDGQSVEEFVTAQVVAESSSDPQFGDQGVGLACQGGQQIPALLSCG